MGHFVFFSENKIEFRSVFEVSTGRGTRVHAKSVLTAPYESNELKYDTQGSF